MEWILKDLYSFQAKTDANILQNNQTTTIKPVDPPVLWEEVERVEGRKESHLVLTTY